MNYTKGPWKVEKIESEYNIGYGFFVGPEYGWSIAHICNIDGNNGGVETAMANALLVSAGPELLEAVSLYLYAAERGDDNLCGEAYWFMREAYGKATQRTISHIGREDVYGDDARRVLLEAEGKDEK
jgi:hypothetical protein